MAASDQYETGLEWLFKVQYLWLVVPIFKVKISDKTTWARQTCFNVLGRADAA